MKKLIVIEGLIGSGKTTLLNKYKLLSNDLDFYEQPLHEWTLLESFYSDPKKYVYPLQEQIINSYEKIFNESKKQTIVMESSALTAYEVYSKLANEMGNLTNTELKIIKNKVDQIHKPDILFYLDVDPEECLKRIKKRGRKGEEHITLEYLEGLKIKFDQFIEKIDKTTKIIRLNN